MRRGRGRGAEQEGFRCALFEYTGKTVVGIAKYNTLREAELRRVLPKAGQWRTPGYGYKERWPEDWSARLDEKIQGPGNTIPVTLMMTHVYEETKKAFAGTTHEDDWMVYHDALSSWWGKQDQQHAVRIGLAERQIRALGPTNAGTRYEGGPVGDSPEWCALDAHCFQDLEDALTFNCALSSTYHEPGDSAKFGMGTPAEVSSSITRVWEVASTSERIIEDVTCSLTRAIDAVIEARGICVPDLVMRSGRRGRRLDGKTGELKRKQRARQQKATNKSKPVHPDNQAAYDAFMADEGDVCELDADESDDESDDKEEDE